MLRRIAGVLRARLPEVGLSRLDDTDPRGRRGLRWKRLSLLLRVPLIAMMAGRKSFKDAEALTAEMSLPMRRLLKIPRRVPDTTMRNTVLVVEPDELRCAMRQQVRAAHRRKALAPQGLPFGQVAVDGKGTAIHSWDDRYAQRQRHSSGPGASGVVRTLTASLVTSSAKVCLDACPIRPATNEMGQFKTALADLVDAYGRLNLFRLISTDAGMCSLANADAVVDRDLDYLMALSSDQPTLFAEANRLLARRRRADAETEDFVGRKAIVRRLYITSDMAAFHGWSHLRSVVRVQSETFHRDTGELLERDDRYFASSLPRHALTDAQWLFAVRAHWAVENNCHNTWDKIFDEDDLPWITRGEGAPQGVVVLMLLRRIAYNMLALFRCVTQRSHERRKTPWKTLLRWVYNTLIAASADDIAGLSPPKALTARAP
ncbi:MAG: ISAs1 family transposase [Alphaproteobacteria bacterium]|nr:MAG: ISAs1 family transposase [Alphaproteobacteria bacterium]